MIDLTKKGSYKTPDGIVWDFYQDDEDSSDFSIVPVPTFARDADGRPIFSLVEYSTSDPNAGGGYCYLSTQLWVPPGDLVLIVEEIRRTHPGITPRINTLQFKAGGQVMLQYASNDGALAHEVYTRPSSYGANVATFIVPLNPRGLSLFKALFSGTATGGTLGVIYEVSADARLPAVTVSVKFDSAIAYEYEKRHTIVSE